MKMGNGSLLVMDIRREKTEKKYNIRQGGAHTEDLHQNGVLIDKTLFELFLKIH